MLRPLEALLGSVSKHDSAARLIFVGDYVNRGPDSRPVIDLLLSLADATFVRGNHDDIFDLLLHDDCYICHPSGPDRLSAFAWFMQHGLDQTLISYGADWAELEDLVRRRDERRLAAILAMVPESHRRFIHALQPVFETEGFFAAHGYWDPDERDDAPPISVQLAADPRLRYQLLWGRFTQQQITRKKRWKRTGYFGHTPVFNYRQGADFAPIKGPNIVLLDTAVALSVSGYLTAACAETGVVIQADRSGRVTDPA